MDYDAVVANECFRDKDVGDRKVVNLDIFGGRRCLEVRVSTVVSTAGRVEADCRCNSR